MVKTFHIREKRVKEGNKVYNIQVLNGTLIIPKSQIISVDNLTKKSHYKEDAETAWTAITVTQWAWNKINIDHIIKGLKEKEAAFVAGETHFDVNWDYIILKRRVSDRCFYCMRKFSYKVKKTKDHLIPRALLKVHGVKGGLPNNTVPCCVRCNACKSNLHPKDLKKYIMRKLHETGQGYYRIVLDTLTRLIVKK